MAPRHPTEEIPYGIARYQALEQLPSIENERLSQAARDVIFARRILPIIAPESGEGPISSAPITGRDLSLSMVVCPGGTGPSLHYHHRTVETFFCLEGCFRFDLGDQGDRQVVIEPFDTLSIPPGVARGFKNVGNDEGKLLVLITGGLHDMDDIAFPAHVADELASIDAGAQSEFEKMGFVFETSK